MLTNTDLKSIGSIMDTRLKPIEKRLANLEKVTSQTQKDVKKVQIKLNQTSDFLDRENLKTLRRVRFIENRLEIPEPAII